MSKKQQLARLDGESDSTPFENDPSCPLTDVVFGEVPLRFRRGFRPNLAENEGPGTLDSLFFDGRLLEEPAEETPRRSLEQEPTSNLGRILTELSTAATPKTARPRRKTGKLFLKGGTTLEWMQATAGPHQMLAFTVLMFMRMRKTKELRLNREVQLAARYEPGGNRWARAIKHLEDCGAFRITRKRGGRVVAIDIWPDD